LEADYVLTGTINTRGGTMRVRAELVDVATDTQQWGERFDPSIDDTLEVETEITNRLVNALRVQITGEERATLDRRRPVNADAHAVCLEGRFWWNKRTPEGLSRAVELYQEAIRLDPEYALAHSELGKAYLMQGVYSHPPLEVAPKAFEALQRAIEIDPSLSEAYAALGFYHLCHTWDMAASEASLKRALDIDPDSVVANHWYSSFLRSRFRLTEARQYIDRAVELDPGNIIVRHDQGRVASSAQEFQSAAEIFERVVEMAPTFQLSLVALGKAKFLLGDRDEGLELIRQGVAGDETTAYQLGHLGTYLAFSGRRAEALEELERLNDLSRRRYVPANAFAYIFAGLGDADRMFRMLEQGFEERSISVPWLHELPELAPYRKDPRFEALHRRHGIPIPDVNFPDLEFEAPHPTIAVLPFEMTGVDADAAYLADEIPASVMDALSELSFPHVIPRSSSFRHRESTATIQEIGEALKADFVLTGQVVARGEELRIRTELVAVDTNRELFSDRIDRSLSDTLAVETEVTSKIVDTLMLPVTDRESKRLAARRPVNAHAHAAYLKGMFWWHRPSSENLLKALEEFQRAATLDPDYALAYLGTAVTYSSLSVYMLPPRETVPKSIAALKRALELDPNLADAYHARAWHEMTWHRDWDAAERDIKESIRLNPRNSIAHFIYGWWHVGRGELDQALSELEQACQLDPGSAVHGSDLGLIRIYAGRFEDARIAIQDALEVDPKSPKAQIGLVLLDSLQGFHDQAIGRARQMEDEGLLFPDYYAFLGDALVRAGRTAEARDFLSELLDRRRDSFVPATEIATIYGALEESESAMQWLETAFEERSPMLFHRLLTYEWRGLRSTPRFRDFAQKVGVDPDWIAPGVVRSARGTN
jgi:serine/threonine-protein kinase